MEKSTRSLSVSPSLCVAHFATVHCSLQRSTLGTNTNQHQFFVRSFLRCRCGFYLCLYARSPAHSLTLVRTDPIIRIPLTHQCTAHVLLYATAAVHVIIMEMNVWPWQLHPHSATILFIFVAGELSMSTSSSSSSSSI